MDFYGSRLTRHDILAGALCLLAGGALRAVIVHPREARTGKVPKAEAAYQDTPRHGQACITCRLFAATGPAKGTCTVVQGEVAARGWCAAYTPVLLTQSRDVRARSVAALNRSSTEKHART